MRSKNVKFSMEGNKETYTIPHSNSGNQGWSQQSGNANQGWSQ